MERNDAKRISLAGLAVSAGAAALLGVSGVVEGNESYSCLQGNVCVLWTGPETGYMVGECGGPWEGHCVCGVAGPWGPIYLEISPWCVAPG